MFKVTLQPNKTSLTVWPATGHVRDEAHNWKASEQGSWQLNMYSIYDSLYSFQLRWNGFLPSFVNKNGLRTPPQLGQMVCYCCAHDPTTTNNHFSFLRQWHRRSVGNADVLCFIGKWCSCLVSWAHRCIVFHIPQMSACNSIYETVNYLPLMMHH